MKPDLQVTIKTLLGKGLSQREIERKTGIDQKDHPEVHSVNRPDEAPGT